MLRSLTMIYAQSSKILRDLKLSTSTWGTLSLKYQEGQHPLTSRSTGPLLRYRSAVTGELGRYACSEADA